MSDATILLIDPCSESRALVRQIVRVGLPGARLVIHDLDADGLPGADFAWSDIGVVLLEQVLDAHGDGLAWLREKQARANLPPVIVLAGQGNEYVAVEAIKSGADNYLNKNDLSKRRLIPLLEESLDAMDRSVVEQQEPDATTEASSPAGDGEFTASDDGIPGYRIGHLLGQGATAQVFLAEKDGLEMVLKILDLALVEDNAFLERFLQEAELVLKMDSPHIVKIYEQAFTDAGCFIAMEYLSGGDLKKRIRAALTKADALSYFGQILRGLDTIHRIGIVHRDLKPANILFRADGTLAIADFGISKEVESSPAITDAGSLLGTPHYISPEQWMGEQVDARSDLYSAGIIFFEMLAGRKPYPGATLSKLIYEHRFGDIPKLDEPLAVYQPIIDLTLAKDRASRIASAAELLDMLAETEAAAA